jgi:hypothetical protein
LQTDHRNTSSAAAVDAPEGDGQGLLLLALHECMMIVLFVGLQLVLLACLCANAVRIARSTKSYVQQALAPLYQLIK